MFLYHWFLNLLMNKSILILAFISSIVSIVLFLNYHPIKQKIISKSKDFFGKLNQKKLNFKGLENIKDNIKLIKNITCIFIMIFFVFLIIYFMFVIVWGLLANQYPNESDIKTLSYYQTHEVKHKQIYLECYNQFIKDDMNDNNKQQFFWKCLKEKF